MKILYIHKKNFTQFLINNLNDAKECDVVVFSFGCFPQINIENELAKKEQNLIDVCHFSRELKAIFVIFCELYISKKCGTAKRAALVISGGKLLGICDEVDIFSTSKFASVNIYEIGERRLCVLVGNNARLAEFMQIAAIYNCDLIVSGVETSCRAATSLGRYFLDNNNINTIICSKNKCEVFSNNFKIANKKNLSLIEIKNLNPKKDAPLCKYLHKTIYENFDIIS